MCLADFSDVGTMICIHASPSKLGNAESIQQSWVKKQAAWFPDLVTSHTYFPTCFLNSYSQALSRQKALEL